MPWSQELRNYVNTQLERRKPRLGARWAALQEELSLCGEEALLLSYLYATLPSADLGDYSPRFFREAARQALAARCSQILDGAQERLSGRTSTPSPEAR